MKLSPILIIGLLLQAGITSAQQPASPKQKNQFVTETVKGTVIDKNTRLPIVGATIVISSSDGTKSVSTDTQGIFRLQQVPVGRQQLQVRMAGYKPEEFTELLITSGRRIWLMWKWRHKLMH